MSAAFYSITRAQLSRSLRFSACTPVTGQAISLNNVVFNRTIGRTTIAANREDVVCNQAPARLLGELLRWLGNVNIGRIEHDTRPANQFVLSSNPRALKFAKNTGQNCLRVDFVLLRSGNFDIEAHAVLTEDIVVMPDAKKTSIQDPDNRPNDPGEATADRNRD